MSLTDEDRNWIAGQLREVETKLHEMETRFEIRIEQVETTLLTEFHKWASPAEARARTHAAALRAIDLEEQLSDRLKALEDRKAS